MKPRLRQINAWFKVTPGRSDRFVPPGLPVARGLGAGSGVTGGSPACRGRPPRRGRGRRRRGPGPGAGGRGSGGRVEQGIACRDGGDCTVAGRLRGTGAGGAHTVIVERNKVKPLPVPLLSNRIVQKKCKEMKYFKNATYATRIPPTTVKAHSSEHLSP